MRSDLTSAQQTVQAIHAALALALDPGMDGLFSTHPHLVLAKVKDERELLKWADKLDAKGVKFSVFREPDIGDKATALATEPLHDQRRSYLKNLQLVGA